MFSLSTALFLLALLIAYLTWTKLTSKPSLHPPGPKTIPLLGNVHLLPMEYQEVVFAEWGRQFGEIVFAKLFRTPTIIISSAQVARDLMEKRSANYSSRPNFTLLVELMGWEDVITHVPYGDLFRKQRKWLHDAFQTKAALESYHPIQRRETAIALSGLVASPEKLVEHFTRFSASIILEITYGHQVKSEDDILLKIAEKATVATVEAGSPGSMIVDFFPILKHYPTWLPGSGFKLRALAVRSHVERLLNVPYNMVKSKMDSGVARPSVTSTLLEECFRSGGPSPEEESHIKGLAGTLYGAGTETTATVMLTFILAMTLHREVFERAQEEIDRVVGHQRLPDFSDRNSLPYLDCIIKEVYRWHPPVPLGNVSEDGVYVGVFDQILLGIPHTSMKDDEYKGYHIPGGSMVIGNLWAMSRDESIYPDPQDFRPERFLGRDDVSPQDTYNPKNFVFGFGRRVCAGAEFADHSVFLLMSSIIATMDISKAKDAKGEEIVPAVEFTSGFVSRPKPFKCSITPRSQHAWDLIAQMNVAN